MVNYNTEDVNKITQKSAVVTLKAKLRAESTGYCLNCGAQVSYCGKPFSAEIACPKCGAINIYVDSQQATALKNEVVA
jgi:Zn finger protein HypA/HybF involved in hydrogenase expression